MQSNKRRSVHFGGQKQVGYDTNLPHIWYRNDPDSSTVTIYNYTHPKRSWSSLIDVTT